MGFRKSEIRVEADVTEEEAADFVTYECPNCGHPDLFHPEMAGAENDSVWCAECAHELGPWGPLYRSIFPGAGMLADTLSKKP